jgi:hypothetical protein
VPLGIPLNHTSVEGDPVGTVRTLVPNAKEPVSDTGVPGAVACLKKTLVVYTDLPATPLDSIDSGLDHVSVVSVPVLPMMLAKVTLEYTGSVPVGMEEVQPVGVVSVLVPKLY